MHKPLLTERAEQILLGLIRDAQALGAIELFLGHPRPEEYFFKGADGQFAGTIHPKVSNELLSRAIPERPVRLSLNSPLPIFLGLNASISPPLLSLSWSPISLIRPKQRLRLSSEERETPPSIVLAEDDHRYRTFLAAALRGRGFVVREAKTGLDALALLAEEPTDLLITDLHMPTTDGYALVQMLRSSSIRIPTIILTSESSPNTIAQLILTGVDAFIRKEECPSILLAWCRRLTGFFVEHAA